MVQVPGLAVRVDPAATVPAIVGTAQRITRVGAGAEIRVTVG